ncbi:MAG TPA: hypothetical protein VGH42_05840 [Verrucomicrobiae bacterium]|jgi:hypothetical protein
MKKTIIASVIIVLVVIIGIVLWPRHRLYMLTADGRRVPIPSYHWTHTLDGRIVHAPDSITQLGTVELTNQSPTRLDLGSGKGCVLTPTVLPSGDIQFDVVVEENDPKGKTLQFTAPQVVTHPDKSISVSVGDICFALTPKLKP